jgi:lipopolysaccharide exporter
MTSTLEDASDPPAPDAADRTAPPSPAKQSLTRQAFSGVLWQGTSFLVGKLLVLLATAILARLLTPSEFGVVGLALVFIGIADVVSDLGVAQALIYMPDSRKVRDAALVCSTAFGLALALIGLITAPLVAGLFHNSEVTPLIRMLSLALLIGALASVPEALLFKHLQFRRSLVANFSRTLTSGVVSVSLALAGAGAWSLVIGQLASVVVYNIAVWSLVDYRPNLESLRPGTQNCRELIAYGLPTAAATLLSKLAFDVDYIIIGALLSVQALGYYTLAFRIPEMAIINVFYVLSTVAFPIYTRASGDMKRLAAGYVRSIELQSAFGLTVAAIIAASAPLLIEVLFGERWRAAVIPLEALAIYAGLRSLSAGAVEVYKAIGRPRLSMWMSLARILVLVPCLLLATHWGIRGVAWGQVIVAAAFVVIMQGLAVHTLNLRVFVLVKTVWPAVVGSIGAVLGVLVVTVGLKNVLPPQPRFLLCLVTGAVTALAFQRLFATSFFFSILDMAGIRRGAHRAVPTSA